MKVKVTFNDGTIVEAEGTESEIKATLKSIPRQYSFFPQPYWYSQPYWSIIPVQPDYVTITCNSDLPIAINGNGGAGNSGDVYVKAIY